MLDQELNAILKAMSLVMAAGAAVFWGVPKLMKAKTPRQQAFFPFGLRVCRVHSVMCSLLSFGFWTGSLDVVMAVMACVPFVLGYLFVIGIKFMSETPGDGNRRRF